MRVTVKKQPFRGSAVGSEISVSQRDARVLIAVGLASLPVKASVAPVLAPVEPPVVKTEQSFYGPPRPDESTKYATKRKTATKTANAYRRRDMKAEGED